MKESTTSKHEMDAIKAKLRLASRAMQDAKAAFTQAKMTVDYGDITQERVNELAFDLLRLTEEHDVLAKSCEEETIEHLQKARKELTLADESEIVDCLDLIKARLLSISRRGGKTYESLMRLIDAATIEVAEWEFYSEKQKQYDVLYAVEVLEI